MYGRKLTLLIGQDCSRTTSYVENQAGGAQLTVDRPALLETANCVPLSWDADKAYA